jgi:cytochrome c-type biogenesis protein CcmH
MLFWIAAGGITLAVTALMLLALRRGRPGDAPPAAWDLRVYRDQLREVERDLARGLVTADEAGRLRADIGRRVLEADRALGQGGGAGAAPRVATLAMAGAVVAILGGAVWVYAARLGTPGYPDLPLALRIDLADAVYRNRPDQASAEAEAAALAAPAPPADPAFLDLMDRLRSAVAARPDDETGLELLARNEAGLGNFAAAIDAQRALVALRGDRAGAADHAALAELMILAAGGYVSPQAEAELTRALQLDPADGTATYYAGLMFRQTGRPDRAFALWAPLLDRSAPDDPWATPLRAQLEAVAAEAGAVNYRLPPEATAPGPTAADIAAAADLSPEDRQAMIRGMVDGLAARLASEGGSAEDWARLIAALGVLGEAERARAIYAEAEERFAGRAADLEALRAAAEGAGLAP